MSAIKDFLNDTSWMIHDLVDADQIDNAEEERLVGLREKALESVEALREMAKFAQHHPNCPDKWVKHCQCGFSDARAKLVELGLMIGQ